MKKIIAVLFGILLTLNLSYGYTFTVDDGRSKIVNEIEAGNTTFVGLEEAEDIRYVIKKGNISLTEAVKGIMQFIMPSEDVWITLIRPGDTKIITATAGANGSISPSGRVSVVSGQEQEFAMTANLGYAVDYVLVDGENLGALESYTFNDVTDFHTIEVIFKLNMFDVTLDAQNGSSENEQIKATYGLDMPQITIPSKPGYIFGGYYTEVNGGGTQYYTEAGASAKVYDLTETLTLYAKWTVATYTVTLNNQSATSAGTTSVTATYNEALTAITVPTRTNYVFAGYFTATGGSGTQYYTAAGASMRNWNIPADTTLYAYWISAASKSFSYTGGMQSYSIPTTGIYKLEVKGAGGQGVTYGWGSSTGAAGGYSVGYKLLTAGTKVYVCVGGSSSRYNGGGSTASGSGYGGGATHMATQSGVLSSLSGATGKVLIVAGGGGGAGQGSNSSGTGGGTTGGGGSAGGTQSAGGSPSYNDGGSGSFGQGGWGEGGIAEGGFDDGAAGGGGGGWYGGGGGGAWGGGGSAGGGGSGYIGGVPQFSYGGVTYSPSTKNGGGSAAANNGSAKISMVAYATADNLPIEFDYTGGIQNYKISKTGLYKLEVWGAGGESISANVGGNAIGAAGGYSVGYKHFTAGTTLYVCVGGSITGYNGGGTTASGAGYGGGATHIATKSGVLSSLSGSKESVLIVAGGGGGAGQENSSSGTGGGLTGGGGASGGTQTAGGSPSYNDGGSGSFGQGGWGEGGIADGGFDDGAAGGGGGGWYGGGGGGAVMGGGTAGGGGSGYIGGVPQVTYNGTTYSPSTTAGAGCTSGISGRAVITFVQ